MAKKRREKTEEEEIDFKLPKFDEEKFLKRERRNIKTLFLSCLFGLIIAVISFGFWVLLSESAFRWELVILLGVFNASWLRYLSMIQKTRSRATIPVTHHRPEASQQTRRLDLRAGRFGSISWLISYIIRLWRSRLRDMAIAAGRLSGWEYDCGLSAWPGRLLAATELPG